MTLPSVDKNVEQVELLSSAGGNINWHSLFGKLFGYIYYIWIYAYFTTQQLHP